MSLLTKLRNILIILKLFYWFALKATIKAVSIKNLKRYHRFYQELISFGPRFVWSISKWGCKSWKARSRWEERRLWSWRTTGLKQISSCTLWSPSIRATSYQGKHQSIQADGRCCVLHFLLLSQAHRLVLQQVRQYRPREVLFLLFRFNTWLDVKFAKSPRPLLLAYPEGHRMGSVTSVNKEKLKTGMIRVIQVKFSMDIDVPSLYNSWCPLATKKSSTKRNWIWAGTKKCITVSPKSTTPQITKTRTISSQPSKTNSLTSSIPFISNTLPK